MSNSKYNQLQVFQMYSKKKKRNNNNISSIFFLNLFRQRQKTKSRLCEFSFF